MSFALYNLMVKLVFVTSLMLPGAQNLLQGQELAEVEAAYAQTLDHRAEMLQQLDAHEAEYRTLLEAIDVLKRGPNTIQSRMELEELLRISRELAKKMQSLQQRIRSTDARLSNQRIQLVAAIDLKMKQIEAKLAQTSAAKRPRLVATLNELRAQRRRFTEPLPNAPTDSEVDQTLAMIEELEGASAADLMAAVDELKDTEDQVRKRLEAIEARIGELRQAKTLARRARNFAAEDNFFDETDRSRFIAGTTGSSNLGGGASRGGNNGTGGADDDGVTSGNNGAPESPAAGHGDEAADPNSDDFDSAPQGDGSLADSPQSPSSAPERQDGSGGQDSGGDDVFGGGDGMLLDNQSDAQRDHGTGFESDYELDSRIRKLEAEQRRLRQQAGELETKARQLRERAKDSLD